MWLRIDFHYSALSAYKVRGGYYDWSNSFYYYECFSAESDFSYWTCMIRFSLFLFLNLFGSNWTRFSISSFIFFWASSWSWEDTCKIDRSFYTFGRSFNPVSEPPDGASEFLFYFGSCCFLLNTSTWEDYKLSFRWLNYYCYSYWITSEEVAKFDLESNKWSDSNYLFEFLLDYRIGKSSESSVGLSDLWREARSRRVNVFCTWSVCEKVAVRGGGRSLFS